MKSPNPMVRAYPGPPRRPAGFVRILLLTVLVLSALYFVRRAAQPAQGLVYDKTGSATLVQPPAVPQKPAGEKKPAADSPLKDTPAKDTPAKDTPAKDTPAKDTPAKDTPAKDTPAKDTPAKDAPAKDKPAKDTPAKDTSEKDAPAKDAPVKDASAKDTPVKDASAKDTPAKDSSKAPPHPIDTLIEKAEKEFDEVLKKETHDLKSAAKVYRERRGRHPPPGFDKWFEFAKENNAIIVEDFFDQVYHDLAPYWGLSPAVMRKEGWDNEMTINIRNNKATAGSDWFWTQIWLNLTQTIEHVLPDMDLPLNAMDEPRIVVPWETINEYVAIERKGRALPPPSEVISEFQTLPPPGQGDKDAEPKKKNWEQTQPFWKIAARGCPPDSLSRKAEVMTDYDHAPRISLQHTLKHSYKGFVSNHSLSTDFCHQPDLQGLHGMMIKPLTISATATLFPMFGGSKLHTNNEILLPAPMYWNNEERFSGGDDHGNAWADKSNQVIWRGVATGGLNTATNWKGFQRHRFMSLTNGTKVSMAESWEHAPDNWAVPTSQYSLAAQQENRLGEWTSEWADTGFVDLQCQDGDTPGKCDYAREHFKVIEGKKMSSQFTRKYLPDIDGNSFSGRYRGFLMSTSLPIKSTIFREWHDSRLFAWKHFVPMDNRFMDFHGIMEYFLGYQGENIKVKDHDKEAEKIATAGQEWANKVLRPEDMQIYVMRVLLEYARLGHDNRDKLGYVKDLL